MNAKNCFWNAHFVATTQLQVQTAATAQTTKLIIVTPCRLVMLYLIGFLSQTNKHCRNNSSVHHAFLVSIFMFTFFFWFGLQIWKKCPCIPAPSYLWAFLKNREEIRQNGNDSYAKKVQSKKRKCPKLATCTLVMLSDRIVQTLLYMHEGPFGLVRSQLPVQFLRQAWTVVFAVFHWTWCVPTQSLPCHIIIFVLFIRELIETAPCEASACTLYKVALNLCEKLAEGHPLGTDKNKNMYDATHTIHQLLCQSSTHCSAGKQASFTWALRNLCISLLVY